MAYNKSKHVNAAQKYVHQGKMPQAIAEYHEILKQEPKDQITLMTLGDLLVRQGATSQALEFFERLAKIFLTDGFTTKAIAIYKKIAKLAPETSRFREQLAELYVQQGVLSEALPLYLQLAEAQLKLGKHSQAAAVLRKLLEAEPDNLRVLTRLAELCVTMGQQKEAIEIFLGVVQRVLDREDHAEAVRLSDRILQIDAGHLPTLLLKARALSGMGNRAEATTLLESLPELDAGGETTTALLDHYVDSGQMEEAAVLAEKVFQRQPQNFALTHRIAGVLLTAGQLDRAQALLTLIGKTMIDAGEHESLAQSFSWLAERRPGQLEPLEWLVDLYGRASDSFHLPDALAQLAAALEAAGHNARALETYEQLLGRKPEDETTRRKYAALRAKMGLEPQVEEVSAPAEQASSQAQDQPNPPASFDAILPEETQNYVTQALVDADLFSSYGLSQKAFDVLEDVLRRAPRHTPALERLLDLSVGAGNDARTVELASALEQIAVERKDLATAEKYAEFRRRFERTPGLATEEPPAANRSSTDAPSEFAVPTIEAQLDEPLAEEPAGPPPAETIGAATPEASSTQEVDLSGEWAALSAQLENAIEPAAAVPAEPPVSATQSASSQAAVLTPETRGCDPQPRPAEPASGAILADLARELESAASALGIPAAVAQCVTPPAAQPLSSDTPPMIPPLADDTPPPVDDAGAAPGGPLDDLFEDFRSSLDEADRDDDDIETHYNLGVAYREMGLLDESISEFQRVAKASAGTGFRYEMQCRTLLGLAFMAKGQPAIAVMWYERALRTPGLDQESILALRYDLGIAQESAGETSAALRTFSLVYAMNIDYRDVSERIALLGKTR